MRTIERGAKQTEKREATASNRGKSGKDQIIPSVIFQLSPCLYHYYHTQGDPFNFLIYLNSSLQNPTSKKPKWRKRKKRAEKRIELKRGVDYYCPMGRFLANPFCSTSPCLLLTSVKKRKATKRQMNVKQNTFFFLREFALLIDWWLPLSFLCPDLNHTLTTHTYILQQPYRTRMNLCFVLLLYYD